MIYVPKPDRKTGLRTYGHFRKSPENKDRCIAAVPTDSRAPEFLQCRFKRRYGPGGAYCRIHDPDAAAERERTREAAVDEADRIDRATTAKCRKLLRRLGIKGDVDYNTRTFKAVERAVISFAELEKLVDRLGMPPRW